MQTSDCAAVGRSSEPLPSVIMLGNRKEGERHTLPHASDCKVRLSSRSSMPDAEAMSESDRDSTSLNKHNTAACSRIRVNTIGCRAQTSTQSQAPLSQTRHATHHLDEQSPVLYSGRAWKTETESSLVPFRKCTFKMQVPRLLYQISFLPECLSM